MMQRKCREAAKLSCRRHHRAGLANSRWQKSRREELVAVRAMDLEEIRTEAPRSRDISQQEVQEATTKACVKTRFKARDSALVCVASRTVRRSG